MFNSRGKLAALWAGVLSLCLLCGKAPISQANPVSDFINWVWGTPAGKTADLYERGVRAGHTPYDLARNASEIHGILQEDDPYERARRGADMHRNLTPFGDEVEDHYNSFLDPFGWRKKKKKRRQQPPDFGLLNADPTFVVPLHFGIHREPLLWLSGRTQALTLQPGVRGRLLSPLGKELRRLSGGARLSPKGLAEGLYTLRLQQGPREFSRPLRVDRSPPKLQWSALTVDANSQWAFVECKSSEPVQLSIRYLAGGKKRSPLLAFARFDKSHRFKLPVAQLPGGTHRLQATASDGAGHVVQRTLRVKLPAFEARPLHIAALQSQPKIQLRPGTPSPSRLDRLPLWLEDGHPSGSVLAGPGRWTSQQAFSGRKSLALQASKGRVAVTSIRKLKGPLWLGQEWSLVQYVYLDPSHPPRALVLGYYSGDDGEHRAYFGKGGIDLGGELGTAGHRHMGALPRAGRWVRIQLPATALGLARQKVTGLVFAVLGGKAYFDRTTVMTRPQTGARWSYVPPLHKQLKDEGGLSLSFQLSRPARLRFRVRDGQGKLLSQYRAGPRPSGRQRIFWKGLDRQKNPYPPGTYTFEIEAQAGSARSVARHKAAFRQLIARLLLPWKPGSLVRAEVPFYGIAAGQHFHRYVLDVGPGPTPTTWKIIRQSPNPTFWTPKKLPPNVTLHGNLGTLDTGLSAYKYPYHPHIYGKGMQGRYTVRLRVFDRRGGFVEDRRSIIVGRLVSNAYGRKLKKDEVELQIPPLSMKRGFGVFSLQPHGSPPVAGGPKPASKVYSLLPTSVSFGPGAVLRFSTRAHGANGKLALARYSWRQKRWLQLPSRRDGAGLSTRLWSSGESHSLFALVPAVAAARPRPPRGVELRAAKAGLRLRYRGARPTAIPGHPTAVRLHPHTRGAKRDFGVEIAGAFPLDLRKAPVLQLRLRFPKGVKGTGLHLALRDDKGVYILAIGPKSRRHLASPSLLSRLGSLQVPDDGRWHDLWIPLYSRLRGRYPKRSSFVLHSATLGRWAKTRYLTVEPQARTMPWVDIARARLWQPPDAKGPLASRPKPGPKAKSAIFSCRVLDPMPGVGLDPQTLVVQVNGKRFPLSHRGLSFDPRSGWLVGDLRQLAAGHAGLQPGHKVQLQLVAAKDWRGNPLQRVLSWSFTMALPKKKAGLPQLGKLQRLTPRGGQMPAFSPDSRRLAFHSRRTGQQDLWELQLGSRRLRRLTQGPGDATAPAYHPKGRWLAYVYRPRPNAPRQLRLLGLSKLDSKLLAGRGFDASRPVWSKDGKALLFASRGQLYATDLTGATPRRIAGLPAGLLLAPALGFRRGHLFAQRSLYGDALLSIDTQSGRRLLLSQGPHDSDPALSNNGRWLAYSSLQGKGRSIFFLLFDDPPGTSGLFSRRFRKLGPLFPSLGRWDRRPTFSPDGQMLAFESARHGARAEIYMLQFPTLPQVQVVAKAPQRRRAPAPRPTKLRREAPKTPTGVVRKASHTPKKPGRSWLFWLLLSLPLLLVVLVLLRTKKKPPGAAALLWWGLGSLLAPSVGEAQPRFKGPDPGASLVILRAPKVAHLSGQIQLKGVGVVRVYHWSGRFVRRLRSPGLHRLPCGTYDLYFYSSHTLLRRLLRKKRLYLGRYTIAPGRIAQIASAAHLASPRSSAPARRKAPKACPHKQPFRGGAIRGPVRLLAACSPYAISESVRLLAGGTLEIDAGVELHFAQGKGLSLEGGRLKAQGRAQAPIVLTSSPKHRWPGAWRGVVNHRSPAGQPHLLSHVLLRYGAAGASRSCLLSHDRGLALQAVTFDSCGGYGLEVKAPIAQAQKLRFRALSAGGIRAVAQAVASFSEAYGYEKVTSNSLLGQNLPHSARWKPQPVPWVVEGALHVSRWSQQPALTLEAGVHLRFKKGRLFIGAPYGGRLRALGTAAQPVRLEGMPAARGERPRFWGGVVFGNRAGASELRHVHIAQAGSANPRKACLAVHKTPPRRLLLHQVAFEGCKGAGLYAEGQGIRLMQGLRFRRIPRAAMVLSPAALGSIAGPFSYGQATHNRILSETLVAPVTWPAQDVPWRVEGDLHVSRWSAMPRLTLQAGVRVEFLRGTFWVGAPYGGSLVALGTKKKPIVLKAAPPAPGKKRSWRGLWLGKSAGLVQLRHVSLEGGGHRTPHGACLTAAQGPTRALILEDSRFVRCAKSGLALLQMVPKKLKGLEFRSLSHAGVVAHPPALASIKGPFRYHQVSHNRILPGAVVRSATWLAQDVPWLATGDLHVSRWSAMPRLTLQAGVRVEFLRGTFWVGAPYGGSLVALGTKKKPIVLKAASRVLRQLYAKKAGKKKPQRGWRGLWIGRNAGPVQLRHASLEGGGHRTPHGACLTAARSPTGKLSIERSRFVRCAKSGLALLQMVPKKLKGLEFRSLSHAGVVAHPPALASIKGPFRYHQVSHNRLLPGTVAQRARWVAQPVPWHVEGNVHVSRWRQPVELKLAPGLHLRFARGSFLVGTPYSGALYAVGSARRPIVLEGAQPRPGAWGGLVFGKHSAKSRLQHLRLRHAGGNPLKAGVRIFRSVSKLFIGRSHFAQNQVDLWIECGSQVKLRKNAFKSKTPSLRQRCR